MILFTLCAAAWADSMVFAQTIGASFTDIVVSEESDSIAALSASQLYIISTKSWTLMALAPCGAFSASGLDYDNDGVLYVGCSDGSISSYDGTLNTNFTALDSGEIYSISVKDKELYAVAEQESGGNPRVHHVDLSTGEESSGSFPSTLGYSSYQDAEIISNFLVISHGGNNLSKMDLSSGSPTRDDEGPTSPTFSDVLSDQSASNALVAGGTGGVILFQLSSNTTQFSLSGDSWGDITALAAGEGSLWIADDQSGSVKEVSYTSGSSAPGSEILQEVTLSGISDEVLEMAVLGEYLYFITTGGSYGVITKNPWLSATLSASESLGDGDSYLFTIVSNQSGNYEVRLGDREGTLLGSGAVTSSEELELTYTVDGNYTEGENEVWVLVENEDGNKGHDVVSVTVDNPPSTPELSDVDLQFGDGELYLNFPGISDPDVSHYVVYLSEELFEPETYETGGPDFEAITEEERTVDAADIGSVVLSPLENDVTYYVALRAHDLSGMESGLSNVVSATPKPTISISEQRNEEGGLEGCAYSPLRRGQLELGVLLLLVLMGRREKRASFKGTR